MRIIIELNESKSAANDEKLQLAMHDVSRKHTLIKHFIKPFKTIKNNLNRKFNGNNQRNGVHQSFA